MVKNQNKKSGDPGQKVIQNPQEILPVAANEISFNASQKTVKSQEKSPNQNSINKVRKLANFKKSDQNKIKKKQPILKNQPANNPPELSEKYYKKFDFFYRRTAFRTMTEYYKGLFRPNLDRWRELEKKMVQTPNQNSQNLKNPQECLDKQKKVFLFMETHNFVKTLFGLDDLDSILPDQKDLTQNVLTSAMLSVVLSHHFQKEEIKKLVINTQVEFSVIRDTMYKYSKKAEEKFFYFPVFAFIFLSFALSNEGTEYTRSKLTKSLREDFGQEIQDELNQPQNKKSKISHQAQMSSRILEEIRNMGFEAHKTLQNAVKEDPNDKILNYMLEKSNKYLEQSDDVEIEIEQPREDTIEQLNTITKVEPPQIQSTQQSLSHQASLFIKTMKSATASDGSPFQKKPQADIGQLLKQIMVDPSFRYSIINKPQIMPMSKSSSFTNLGKSPGVMPPILLKSSPNLLIPKPKVLLSNNQETPFARSVQFPKTPVWNHPQVSTKVSENEEPPAQAKQ